MDYTKNHHLPQWIKSDRIMMDDFNEAMSNIESGITNAQTSADAARSAASSAQSTANTARQEAAAKPYATGSYTGTGADLDIRVGFRPSFVIISGLKAGSHLDIPYFGLYSCITAGSGPFSQISFTSTGFHITETMGTYPQLSGSGRVYEYIAFK